jgi:hypothetical protein
MSELSQIETEIEQFLEIARRGIGGTTMEFENHVSALMLRADELRATAGKPPAYSDEQKQKQ